MISFSERIYSLFTSFLSPDMTGVALGVTFGIKEYVPSEISRQMKIIGASHILVLSGANISLLMNFLTQVLSFLPNKTREICAIVGVLVFLSLVPIQASIVRAAIMSIVPRIGGIVSKRVHPLYLLLLSCISIIAFDTRVITEISFQLSFLAVLGMILFAKPEQEEAHKNPKLNNVKEYIFSQLSVSLAAQSFTAPLIFYYFGTISLISPLSNIVLAPFITPIMSMSILFPLITTIFPFMGEALYWLLYALLFIFLYLIQIMASYKSLYLSY